MNTPKTLLQTTSKEFFNRILTKAAIQATYSLNVGNLRDTGHLDEAMPPAAMAELLA